MICEVNAPLQSSVALSGLEVVALDDIRLTPGDYSDIPSLGSGRLALIERHGGPAITVPVLRNSWHSDRSAIVRVVTDDLNFSKGLLVSEDFYVCQCLLFWSPASQVGCLAHFSPYTVPHEILNGRTKPSLGDYYRAVPLLDDIFPDSEKADTRIVHITSADSPHSMADVDTEVALKGFLQPVQHLEFSEMFWRDIALDCKSGTVWIVGADWRYPGIYKIDSSPTS